MNPIGDAAVFRRAYIQQRLIGHSPAEARHTIATEYGVVSDAVLDQIAAASELAIGTANRANLQTLSTPLQYAAYAGVDLQGPILARVRVTYSDPAYVTPQNPEGVVHNSAGLGDAQFWAITADTTRLDLRQRAAQWLAQRYPGDTGAYTLVAVEYEAIIYA